MTIKTGFETNLEKLMLESRNNKNMTKAIADTYVDLTVPDTVLCILDILMHSSRQAHEDEKIDADSNDLSSVKKLASGRDCNPSLS